MPKYVAFLRGINSGKHPTVKMDVLRNAFEELGFENVSTVLASGNVLFEADSINEKELEKQIEKLLPGAIGFESGVIIRTVEDIHKLVRLNPFKNVQVTPQTRLYVTFLKMRPGSDQEFPVKSAGYRILGIFENVVCSIVDLLTAKTPDLMQVLDKTFGIEITTRNWNTVVRILTVANSR